MSKIGKFVKKHPWEAAAMAATAAIGGPAAMAMLEGGTAASGVAGAGAGLFGASDATAALAGDAFMPAALGSGGGGVPSLGSTIGSKFASDNLGGNLKKMGQAAKYAGLLNPQPPAPMGQAPTQGMAPTMTNINNPGQSVVGGPVGDIDPRDPRYAFLFANRGMT